MVIYYHALSVIYRMAMVVQKNLCMVTFCAFHVREYENECVTANSDKINTFPLGFDAYIPCKQPLLLSNIIQ